MQIISTIRGALKDRRGITALEYGLIGAIITVVIVTGLNTMSGSIGTAWNTLVTEVGKVGATTP